MNDINNDLREAERTRSQIQMNLDERDRKRETHDSTERMDNLIRGSMQKMAVTLDHVARELSDISENPSRYRVSPTEVHSLREQLKSLEDQLAAFTVRFKKGLPQITGTDLGKGSAAMILERGVSTRTSASQDIFLPKVLIDLKGCSSIQAIADDRSSLF